MKVYELMALLAEMDAGAEVIINTLISKEEYLGGYPEDEGLTSLKFRPCEVDEGSSSGTVYIATEVVR